MDDWLRIIVVVAVPSVIGMIWLARWSGKLDGWVKEIDGFKADTEDSLNRIHDDIKKILASQPRNVISGTSPVRLADGGTHPRASCPEAHTN